MMKELSEDTVRILELHAGALKYMLSDMDPDSEVIDRGLIARLMLGAMIDVGLEVYQISKILSTVFDEALCRVTH